VTKPSDVERLAHELHEYVRFRAAKEGVGYELTPGFFCDALKKGCDNFFGVQVGAKELLWDDQFPEFFAEWKSSKVLH
jgi:hypothetical protein